MKKQLLFMCALCLSAAQAWAQPALPVQGNGAPQWQVASHAGQRVETPLETNTLCPMPLARAGEGVRPLAPPAPMQKATAPSLSVAWSEAAFPMTCPGMVVPAFPWSGDYSVTLTVANAGSDFSDGLFLALCRVEGDQYVPYHLSDTVPVTLRQGETKQLTFTGQVGTDVPIGGQYYLILVQADGEGTIWDYYPYYAYVLYPLTVLSEGTSLPASINMDEDYTATVRLRNDGNADVRTDALYLSLLGATDSRSIGSVSAVTIPHGGTAEVEIPLSVYDWLGANCLLGVCYFADNMLYPVGFDNGDAARPVTVYGYDLVLASDNELPATIHQHATDTLTVHLLNRGNRDFLGYVVMALADDASGNYFYYMSYAEGYGGLVEAGGEAYMDIPYNISNDVAPGSYYLMIYAGETMLYPIPAADDPARVSYPVEVVYQPGPQLTVLYGESSFPAEVVQGSTFEVSLAIANTGEAAYEGEVWLTLNEVTGASRHTFDSIPVTIPVNDTVHVPFALTADIDLPRPRAETLYWYVSRSLGGGLSESIAFDDLTWPSPASTTFQPNPELQPVLTWVESQSAWPQTLTVGQRYTPSMQVKNAGKDFEGDLMFALVGLRVDEMAGVAYYEVRDHSPLVHVSIPRDGGQTVTFDYTVSDSVPAGNDYYIGLYQVADGEHHALYTDEGGAFMPVSVLPGEASGMPSPGDEAFALYPNPATDRMTVTALSGIGRVRLYSSCGTLVLDEPCDGLTHDLDLGTLPPGIYLLQATMPEGIRTGRVVKR